MTNRLKQSLSKFSATLESLGAKLVIRRSAEMLAALLEVCEETGARSVHFNHLFDPVSLVRDNVVKQGLQAAGIQVHTYNADLLFEPWNVLGDDGLAFNTYDAFWAKCLSSGPPPSVRPASGVRHFRTF